LRRPACYTLAGLVGGVLAAHILGVGPRQALAASFALFAVYSVLLFLSRARGLRDPVLLAVLAAVSSLHFSVRTGVFPAFPEELLEAEELQLFGRVVSDVRERYGEMDFLVRADSARLGDALYRLDETMRVSARSTPDEPGIGELWVLRGHAEEPRTLRNPGGFDSRAWHRGEGVRYLFDCSEGGLEPAGLSMSPTLFWVSSVSALRDRFSRIFEENVGGEEAELLKALLLGQRTVLPEDTLNLFRDSGLIHILAVSGLHVGIIWFILVALLRTFRIPHKSVIVFSSVFLVFYCFLAGLREPVVRATIMFVSLSVAFLLERELDPLNALSVAALFIVLGRPWSIFDVGFQLSFACTFSIIRLLGITKHLVRARGSGGRRLLRWILGVVLVSAAAQVGSIPLTMHHFHRFSLLPLVANVLVVPLAALDIWFGLLVGFLRAAGIPLAGLVGAANWLSLRLTLLSVRAFSSIPLTSFRASGPPLSWIFVWYAVLSLLPDIRRSARARFACLLCLLVGLNAHVWNLALKSPEPTLTVALLDVGQGDCTVMRTRTGQTLVLDSGPRYGEYDCGESTVAPFLWQQGIRRIDLLVLTHPHNDHIGGFSFLLDHLEVGEVIDPGIPFASTAYLEFLSKVREKGIDYRPGRRGMTLTLGDCGIALLHPDQRTVDIFTSLSSLDPNDASIVLRIDCGLVDLLFTGDINSEAGAILGDQGEVTLFKVPHHGSLRPNRETLESGLHASIAVFSVGANNRFGLPSEETVLDYAASGSRVLRTDRDGCIIFTTDGQGYRVTTLREMNSIPAVNRLLRNHLPR
jgi:competence protein ComEC